MSADVDAFCALPTVQRGRDEPTPATAHSSLRTVTQRALSDMARTAPFRGRRGGRSTRSRPHRGPAARVPTGRQQRGQHHHTACADSRLGPLDADLVALLDRPQDPTIPNVIKPPTSSPPEAGIRAMAEAFVAAAAGSRLPEATR
jgi:hypothetical protein